MATNFILPWSTGAGANALSDLAYSTNSALAQGLQTGIVPSNLLNKILRQSTAVASGFGAFTAQWSGQDFSDSLSPGQMAQNFQIALAAAVAGAQFGIDSSAVVNLVTVTLSPVQPVTSGAHSVFVKIANTNTGPVTMQENGSVGVPVVRNDGSAVQAGDLTQGVFSHLIRDGASYKLAGISKSQIAAIVAAAVANSGGSNTGNTGGSSQTGPQIITANRVPSNLLRLPTNSRAALGGSGALYWVNAMAVPQYTKVGAAGSTNLLIIAEIAAYTPQQGGAGATYSQMTDGAGHTDQKGLSTDFNLSGVGAISIKNTATFLLQGVPAGSVNLTLQFSRQDGTTWYTIANPDGVDYGGSGSHTGQGSTSTFTIMEIPV